MLDKFDPEQYEPDGPNDFDLGDPEKEAEDLVPEVPSPEENYEKADPRLRQLFWKLVILYKFSLMGLALGAMLVVFGVYVRRGAGLLVLSAAVFLWATFLARRVQRRAEAGEFETIDSTDESEDTSDSAGDSEPVASEEES